MAIIYNLLEYQHLLIRSSKKFLSFQFLKFKEKSNKLSKYNKKYIKNISSNSNLYMDKVTIQNLKCNKHPNKNLQFIQVNDVLTQPTSSKPLFYCSSCFNHDLQFKSINYLMIDQIIQEADTNIIPKWPPVNNYQIISDLIDLTSNQSSLDYIKQITDFFHQLKEEFLNKIDVVQKKMINEALKYPIDTQQIIKRYQEISNIHQFKQILNNEQPNNLQDNSTLCKEFISQMESQKDKNTELLQSLLTQTNQLQKNFNIEYPHAIKQQLFTFIDQIYFFNLDIPEVSSTNHYITTNHQEANIINQSNQIEDLKLTSDLIMKLVSNKSNFCSDQFLNKLSESLQRINPLLKQFSFNTAVFKDNKEQIDFSKISEEKINLIEEYVKHQIALSRGEQQFQKEVKDSQEIKQMTQIVDSKMSFLRQEFIQQFEKFLVDVKPFLKQINFTNSFTDKNKFDFFRNLKDNKWNAFYEESLPNLDLKLLATQWSDGQTNCVVNKKENGYYEIEKLNTDGWVNCISNTNLQQDKKYIFRIKVENLNENQVFMIGLVRNSIADQMLGYLEYLSCYLQKINQSVFKCGRFGIDKQLKGAGFQTSEENIIELRLCLKKYILEVLDYPNYEYKLGLEDIYKNKLHQFDDLRFYLGIHNQGSKLILMDVKIVNEFIN
ncbi:zinc carboxypeptidase family protein (macronuclear) [Tetrahymena thermophila SB210]|uniref:Zinc carboxypeptidase family protein n=1 Tax=Tetrahymena thermophila (strain SB210) TaxID=312017 RepID=W7XGL1_TETTS|nr:zinc carboxypeptidase family protein [Tetrahymena thermophila SB210]EWS76163.1 zinc carboxypeptidase family protein [Tetrahymena thermophila SB210]|eukprot:XP_012651316.1 zinc carboxypeptidase family protein [Tetrahymena thermophila SB210]